MMKDAVGVLRSFGKKGYRPSDAILQKMCPHIRSGTSEYANALQELENSLDAAAHLGLARRDDLDLPEALIPCYEIV